MRNQAIFQEFYKKLKGRTVTDTLLDEIIALREQVKKLTKERDELKTVPMKYRRMQFNAELQDEVTQLQKQLAALAEQNEKNRNDAERYRWLRAALSDRSAKGQSHHFCSIKERHPEELDAAIDDMQKDKS